MTKKKLFACLTALCCLAGCINGMGAFAEVPDVIDLSQPGDGAYGLVTDKGFTNSNFPFIYVKLLSEENYGKVYRFCAPARETSIYQSEEDPAVGDLIYYEFSGTCEDSEMTFDESDLVVTLGPIENYLEKASFVCGKYESELRKYPMLDPEDNSVVFYADSNIRVDSVSAAYGDMVVYGIYNDDPLLPVEIIEREGKYDLPSIGPCGGCTFLVLSVSQNAETGALTSMFIEQVTGPAHTAAYAEFWALTPLEVQGRISGCYSIGCGADLDAMLEGQKFPEPGDLLYLDGVNDIAEIYPACMHFGADGSITNLGSAEEIGERKTLTVTEENGYRYIMQDAEGIDYYYYDTTPTFRETETLMSTVKTGDRVDFMVYENEPALALSVTHLGDVNADGKVSIVDVIMLNHHIMGAEAAAYSASSADRTAADFNGDGSLTADDSLSILKRLVGLA